MDGGNFRTNTTMHDTHCLKVDKKSDVFEANSDDIGNSTLT
jgi:hypothetical protein